MVYCGKLSNACQQCRNRVSLLAHLKHASANGPNQSVILGEACGQCVRARLTCSGYRDTHQLRVRDQSQAVVRKALRRGAESLRYSITPKHEDRAKNAFSHYVFNNSKTYDFLQSVYSATSTEALAILGSGSIACMAR